ncbi:MAG: EamA family transporter [Legionella sp.]
MPVSHLMLALMVVVIWGVNFLFVKFGLDEISSLQLCALRFFLASIPAVFFIKRPEVPFRYIVAYGLIVFALQFGLLFMGMEAGMAPGMTSLIMQVQVFFSMFFAMVFLKEKPKAMQIIGALIAFSGIGLVALHFDKSISGIGFILILAAAASWGLGNLITKKINSTHLIAVIVWGSFIATLPMFIMALLVEGPRDFIDTFEHLTWHGFGALLYIVYASTWLGYGVWNWLITRYPVAMIVPFTLLVPVVGIFSSVVVLNEPFAYWQLTAGMLVLLGLAINVYSTRKAYVKR